MAIITDLTGSAELVRGGVTSDGEILMSLSTGDTLQLGGSSSLTLVFYGGTKEFTISDPGPITILAAGPGLPPGVELSERDLQVASDTALLPMKEGYAQAAFVFRNSKTPPKIILLHPKKTKILSLLPLFEWQALEGRVLYRFVLTDSAGRTLIDAKLKGNEFSTPQAQALIPDHLYAWRVEAHLTSGESYSASARFSVLAQTQLDTLDTLRPLAGATFSERVVFAMLLDQFGARREAAKYWNALAAGRPDSQALQERLGKK